jgi:hypothetical protein
MGAPLVAVGDKVLMFDVNERAELKRTGRPGIVSKVGTRLVSVVHEEFPSWAPTMYRLDTQQLNGDFSQHGWFRTLDQQAEYLLRTDTLEALRTGFGLGHLVGSRAHGTATTAQLVAALAAMRAAV